ncbi:GntR family transcriptional regulator [Thalassovita aquimarina]|uniref:GntR family transcriptional regulator n=1 Tax=Thalassovita aquimarina TaxID=2785917 RepID=A0ABS5HWL9_9RHOB|nr:GntR family transcriptional regulator [Thalassovita aquimarina]MBR9653341.1 GntR family transcriptional regulator [Thalassovita aquimarina]
MTAPTLADQIANRLRHAILLGELAPGSSVGERDYAQKMGVSRTPMREAIRILAKEGLLVLRPSFSPVVADPSLKQVEDELTIIRALEVLSGELACAHATEAQIGAIRALHERMVVLAETEEMLQFFETDMAFHRAIARASDNARLDELHGQLLARLWRVRFLSARQAWDRDRVLKQHTLIVAGLEARDADLVRLETDSHIQHIKRNIQGHFRRESL